MSERAPRPWRPPRLRGELERRDRHARVGPQTPWARPRSRSRRRSISPLTPSEGSASTELVAPRPTFAPPPHILASYPDGVPRTPDEEPGRSYPHALPHTPRVVEPPPWMPPSTNGDPAQTPEISGAVRPSADQTTEGRTSDTLVGTSWEDMPTVEGPEPVSSIWDLLSGTSASAADIQSDKIIRSATDMIMDQVFDIGSVATKAIRHLADERQRRHAAESDLADERKIRHAAESDLADERKIRRDAESQVANYQSQVVCVMCKVEERSVLLQPCWHLVSCSSCQHMVDICPLCRTRIDGRLRVNLA